MARLKHLEKLKAPWTLMGFLKGYYSDVSLDYPMVKNWVDSMGFLKECRMDLRRWSAVSLDYPMV